MDLFHPSIYLLLNDDLRRTKYNTPQMAKFHYQNYGIAEGRPNTIRDLYPDFRPEYYNTFNIDLQRYKMKPVDLALHFLNKGRFENRMYKPILDSSMIYIYTDNINYSKAEYFENILKSMNLPVKITTDGILNTNCMYLLLTHRQIKLYPFYFLLCLDNYDIPKIVLDLCQGILTQGISTQGILTQTPQTPTNLEEYNYKMYYIDSSTEYADESYLMKRMLLANEFPKIEPEYLLDSNKIFCITQPEHQYRFNKFDGQRYKPQNLQYIVGLKHNVPWIGCGMTYREIAKNAMKLDLPYITICNDDVIFREDFAEKYEKIMEYLKANENWDLFTGIMNINDPYLRILNKIKVTNELELLQVDVFSGLGFLVIRKSMFEKMSRWDTIYRNFPHDKLVQYLQRDSSKLTILTTNPFLVDSNYDVKSTISKNKKNEVELNKITMCENIIRTKKCILK